MSKSPISRRDIVYWSEVPLIEYTEDLARLMTTRRISRTKLAELIDVSPAYITKVLRGDANFTLQTMTRLSLALGSVVHVHLAPVGAKVVWRDAYSGDYRDDDLTVAGVGKAAAKPLAVSTTNPNVFADAPAAMNG